MTQELVNPKFIDLPHEDRIDPETGEPFPPGYAGEGEDWPLFGSAWPSDVPVLQPDQWMDAKREQEKNYGTMEPARLFCKAYNDQSPESSCVFNMYEVMFRNRRNRTLGIEFEIKNSPMWGYQFNCSGRHSGAYTMDALKWGMEVGYCPEHSSAQTTPTRELTLCHERSKALAPHSYHQNTPYEGKRTFEQAKATARWQRLLLPIHINDRYQFISALIYGWGVGNGRSGHSIAHLDAVKLRSGSDSNPNNWGSMYLDSYDVHRGDNGFLYDSYNALNTSGAWAFREIWMPDNPQIFPFGSDTKSVTLEKCYELFPDADRDYVQQLYDQGPGDAVPPAGLAA